jgi:AraC family ethanolamine operon transcriptional activator
MIEDSKMVAPKLCVQSSFDANHQANCLKNWQQEYSQLSDGEYSGQVLERRFTHLHVFREDSNRALKQDCLVEDGGLWLGVAAKQQPLFINNEQTRPEQMLVRSGGVDFQLITPELFSIYGIVIDKPMLQSIEDILGAACGKESLHSCIVNSPNHVNQITHYLSILLSKPQTLWSCQTHEKLLKDFIVDLLSTCLQEITHPIQQHRRHKIMERVQQQLTGMDMTQPITVTDLCNSVHVSRRTLQYTFETCCGMSPSSFIQKVRLNQVRKALQSPSHSFTVYETAYRFGFYHLGEFAKKYRVLFGESPSDTITKKKGQLESFRAIATQSTPKVYSQ